MNPPASDDGENNNLEEESQNFSESPVSESPVVNQETPLDTTVQTPPPEPEINQDPNIEAQTSTPQIQTPQEVMADSSERKSHKPLYFFLFISFLILILTSLGGLTYAVAYEKIKLEKYPDFQKKVAAFVMEIPFMPKTPKFLLAKSAMAHQDITKQSFDISMAIDSADLSSSLGLSNLDVQAKGAFDYTDPKNVFGNFELSITKDFNMELKKKDEMLYFKLNKLPSFLFAFMGIGAADFDPLVNKWVSYDTTPLDTEARMRIQEDREVDPLSEEFIDKNFEKFLDEEVLSKMQIETGEEEGHSVYEISLNADSVLIDHLGKKIEENSRQKSNLVYPQNSTDTTDKLSDFVKKLKWEIYIDKESYFTRKVIVSIDLEYDSSDGLGAFSMGSLINPVSATKNNAKIAFAAKFDKFGEDVLVEEPVDAITFEEFTELLSATISGIYNNSFSSTYNLANDARRMSDLTQLRAALEMYRVDTQNYPSDLADLSDTYIVIIPTDPDGSSYYYRASSERNSYDLCAYLNNPPEDQSTCPDPSFNYHLTQP